MSTNPQMSAKKTQCLHHDNKGNQCPRDARENSLYCPDHGPDETGQTRRGGFEPSRVDYAMISKKF
jgi:hypothetical protein